MSFPVYAVGHSEPTHRLVPSPVALSLSKEDGIAEPLAEAIVPCHRPTTGANKTEPVGLTKADDDDDKTKQALETIAENIDDIADNIADKDIVDAETQPNRLRIRNENRLTKVNPKAAALCICGKPEMPNRAASPLAAPPGLTPTASTTGFWGCASPPAPPGLSAPPGAGFVSEACQVSKESLTTESTQGIQDLAARAHTEVLEEGLKFFNNQSRQMLKLIKVQNEQLTVQSAQIEAQCKVLNRIKAQNEQLRVQSARIEAQCEVLNMQSEQLKQMSVLLLAGVPLA